MTSRSAPSVYSHMRGQPQLATAILALGVEALGAARQPEGDAVGAAGVLAVAGERLAPSSQRQVRET
jgi:TRAP-type mannitol/chloroaromatic compound transport system permease large subunit